MSSYRVAVTASAEKELHSLPAKVIARIIGRVERLASNPLRAARNSSAVRQAAGIAVAKKRGVYTGRRQGTTKAAPSRARALRKQGLTVLEIAQALGVKERTVYHYLI